MTRTRRPASARAAPRLTAVVVLPTPPFWLATAMIRPGRTALESCAVALSAAAFSAASPSVWPAGDLFQGNNDTAGIRPAGVKRGSHCPGPASCGQFFRRALALQKQAGGVRSDKPLCKHEKSVERGAAAGRHDIGRVRREDPRFGGVGGGAGP